jgi:hypothetical protein
MNGMILMSGMKSQQSAAVTMALLKFAGSARLKRKYNMIPISRNINEVKINGMIA